MMKSYSYFGLAIALAILAFLLQSQIFLCGDVAYLLHVTDLLLSGGSYARDFFETNPPMILYLYSPVVYFAKLGGFSVIPVVRAYVLIWAFISLICCYILIFDIFSEKNSFAKMFFLYCLLFVLLFLPAGDFGQREHFFLILILPYMLSAVCRLENKTVPSFFAILIGVMAGLGLGMKPFFLAPMLLVEGYLIFKQKSFFAWWRLEILVAAFVLIAYLLSIVYFESNYIHIILPLVSHLYFLSSRETWGEIFSHGSVLFTLLIILIYWKMPFKTSLENILFLAFIGMVIAFLIPRSAWYYHLIPAVGLGCLLLSLSFTNHSKSPIFMLIFLIPLYSVGDYFYQLIHEKNHSDRSQLLTYVKSDPLIHSVYCFSASFTQDCFPLVQLSQKNFAGRAPFFWWIRGLVSLSESPDKNYLLNSVAEDLNHYQGDLIIINSADMKVKLGSEFDTIHYFSQNENFKNAWTHYQYVKTIGDYQLFRRIKI